MKTTLRERMIVRIHQRLLENETYGEYINNQYSDPESEHARLVESCNALTDETLLNLYTRMMWDHTFFPTWVERPDRVFVSTCGYFGAMLADGSCHT